MFKLLASYAITSICSWAIAFLIPLYVYEQTGSPVWTSLAFFAAMAPYILVTPFAGVWSDRYSKRRFLIGGDLINIVTGCLIYAAVSTLSGSNLSITLLLLSFLLASVGATHHPVFQSIAPALIEGPKLHRFNAIVNASDNIIRIVAPIGVAALLAFSTKEQLLIGSIVGFALSLPLCFLLKEQGKPAPATTRVFTEIKAGLLYVIQQRELCSFVMLFFFCNFGFALIGASLVYVYTTLLAVPLSDVGYYYGLIGAGAVAGSAMGGVLVKRYPAGILIRRSCLLAGVFTLMGAMANDPWSLSALWALSTGCQSVVVIAFFTYRQQVVPQTILGRTVGVTRLIAYLAIPPASLLSGWLLLHFSSSAVILASGGLCIIFASLCAYFLARFERPVIYSDAQ
ncbi:MFS family permease [Pseudomonas sp. JAI115]|uniref:MFS transporter n=1 Tax=Pseudomonas sp. JAI115 TaxID=2723061 RepID=UPI001622D5D9|nr:MFS transporter [Pseudomonas sp. JAI115]MBB6156456.1 MFS family permease [Pseudomonas sp. JAI115]